MTNHPDRPLICTPCGGQIAPDQPVTRPMPPFDPATDWAMHTNPADCLRVVLAQVEQEDAADDR